MRFPCAIRTSTVSYPTLCNRMAVSGLILVTGDRGRRPRRGHCAGATILGRNTASPITFCHIAYKRGDGRGGQSRRVSTPRETVLGDDANGQQPGWTRYPG